MGSASEKTASLADAEALRTTSEALPPKGELRSEWVLCSYGQGNTTDYVLHIEPLHPKRTFPPNLGIVCNIVYRHLHNKFPVGVQVEIDLPEKDWLLQHIVFVAKDAVNHWSFDEMDIEKALPELLQALDDLVIRYANACKIRR
jgi:hypothetical protein